MGRLWDRDRGVHFSAGDNTAPWHHEVHVGMEMHKPSTALWCLVTGRAPMITMHVVLPVLPADIDWGKLTDWDPPENPKRPCKDLWGQMVGFWGSVYFGIGLHSKNFPCDLCVLPMVVDCSRLPLPRTCNSTCRVKDVASHSQPGLLSCHRMYLASPIQKTE